VPDAKFLIVGKSPNETVRRLAKLDGVELHADVPDVRLYLSRSSVAVVPLQFARGVQNKVLEAMAMRKAVVATPQALEGLRAERGAEVLEARNAEELAAALRALFQNDAQVRRLGLAAGSYAEKNHGWDACLQPFAEHLFSDRSSCLGSGPNRLSPNAASLISVSVAAT
jgi:glycosyltransferase involved in cell wall biosynthesis